MIWTTARRQLTFHRPLVMGILNVTPDSFSDGGEFESSDAAVARAEEMATAGADIIDIGGESTRPGSSQVSTEVEIGRVIPIIRQIAERIDLPISIDTSKSAVAAAAIEAGAEIINDISGLRWNPQIADVAAQTRAGLVLMHSRGSFETMHSQAPVENIFESVIHGLRSSLDNARQRGVTDEHICLDVGIGFGKTLEQNLELIAQVDKIVTEFADYPLLVGTSRKSFIGKLLGGIPADQRIGGSIATALIAAQRGAKVLRVHDVRETVAAIKIWQEVEAYAQ